MDTKTDIRIRVFLHLWLNSIAKRKYSKRASRKKKTCKKQNVNLLRAKPTHIHTLLTTSFTDPKTFPNKFNFIINAGPLIFFPVIQKEVYFFLKFEYILFF